MTKIGKHTRCYPNKLLSLSIETKSDPIYISVEMNQTQRRLTLIGYTYLFGIFKKIDGVAPWVADPY